MATAVEVLGALQQQVAQRMQQMGQQAQVVQQVQTENVELNRMMQETPQARQAGRLT